MMEFHLDCRFTAGLIALEVDILGCLNEKWRTASLRLSFFNENNNNNLRLYSADLYMNIFICASQS